MTQYNGKSEVTGEELGMRAFHLRKARAVERAMERLRRGLGGGYATLTHTEMETVSWIFGELWAYVARVEWDDLHFSNLALDDIRTILGHAKEIADHDRNSVDVLQDVYDVVAAKA
jgi:hypothetical protein